MLMGKEKIIALFNNKGGVSKTTTAYNLGWMLAQIGKRTLIVDSDPQCNLTGVSISTTKETKLEELYNSDISNIKFALEPVLGGNLKPLEPVKCYEFKENPNLFLLPGHIQFSEYDATYNIAETMTGSLVMLKNVPGAYRKMIALIAEKYDIDYVLVDMSPSISATNANIFMQSDYFIVPCAPDYFCYMAIEALTSIFPRWNKNYRNMAENEVFKEAEYKLKETPPLFLGTIQQRYRPRNGAPARAFAEWIKEINELVKDKLLPVLKENNMCISEEKLSYYDDPYNLINIADFNSLIAQSQEHNTPIFLLTQEQVKQTGITWTNMERSRDEFFITFKTLAERIINVTA
ncbi:MAG: AAA family ATPase [Lachnospiraceae bacterium]|nr:AAA family ATPase [Lachnospiraceae bacterium]